MPTTKLQQDRELLKLLGIDPSRLSDADTKTGAELARRISACDRIPGAGKRRTPAIADWQAFLKTHSGRE
jgi:hypothetical protein